MRVAKFLIITMLSGALCSCARPTVPDGISDATHILSGIERYPQIGPEYVEVFLSEPNFQFKTIGIINARGMANMEMYALRGLASLDVKSALGLQVAGEKEDLTLAMRALKKEAASIGANGVIIKSNEQIQIGYNASERRISGVAIRY
ncbi:hypothetical protein [Magnetospirillum sp. SS-4]|uniref:hypothetical protein n=1 Tax=Magnetospirillum sp. SS-4 TaxID=2681465 RepID=UPI001571D4C8|nr:hypothetical protein [Magnetospirillum sp. SS-4]